MTVELERLEEMIAEMKVAQAEFAKFTQAQVDVIFRTAAIAANAQRIPLAKEAVVETGMGVVEDKVIKNHFAAEIIYNKYKHTTTCGVLDWDKVNGYRTVAEPVGLIAGVVPTTNPTSTAIFKALITLKTRNAIIFSPHPRAKACTKHAVDIIRQAAEEAGAPKGLLQVIEEPSVALSTALMQHPEINLILATGGPGMVRSAYTSGKPALGVGAGNTPAIIDETADVRAAVNSILVSKTFDHGVICASEQSVIVHEEVYEQVKRRFKSCGARILNKEERQKVRDIVLVNGHINAQIVGQSAIAIAEMAGITVPAETRILVGEVSKIGESEPLSYEKLSPVLAMYKAKDFDDAVDKARRLVEFGGIGHTSVLYTHPNNGDRVIAFSRAMKTGRVLINTPSSQGAIGDLYNFKLEPSLTLGCGTWGGNAVAENVGVKHLMNIKTVAERRENMMWYKVPPKIYFKHGSMSTALRELKGKKRAVI